MHSEQMGPLEPAVGTHWEKISPLGLLEQEGACLSLPEKGEVEALS